MLNDIGQQDKVENLLAQLHAVLSDAREGPDESILNARIRLQRVFSDIQQDPVAGLLRESGEYRHTEAAVNADNRLASSVSTSPSNAGCEG